MYVADTQQGDEAGDEGAEVAVESRVSVQAECQKCAGEAGHRDAALPHGNIRQRRRPHFPFIFASLNL